MRKIVSILFLSILLFNLFGYRIVIDNLQYKSDSKLEKILDNNEYDESQLIEIRVPINMPYQQRHTEFERHYGEINIEGKSYTYVKRKMEGNMLVLKCIANYAKEEFKNFKNDLAKANSAEDMEHSGNHGNQKSFLKNSLGDYDDLFITIRYMELNNLCITPFADFKSCMHQGVTNIPHQPPRFC